MLAFGLIAIVGVGYGVWRSFQPPPPSLNDAKKALTSRRLTVAESISRSWLKSHRGDADAILVLGESLQRQGKITEAIEAYDMMPKEAGRQFSIASIAMASMLLREGRLEEAESRLLSMKPDPNQSTLVDGLWVTLLSLAGRRWESMPYLQRSLVSSGDPLMNLIYLANPDEMPAPPEDVLAKMLKVRDPLGSLGVARVAASLGRQPLANELIGEVLTKRPDLIDAHALKGLLLLDEGKVEAFDEWARSLPDQANAYPSIWFLKGRCAQDLGNRPEAIRCFWEAVRRQPDHDRANYQLGQLLAAVGRTDDAAPFLERSKRLRRLSELAVRMFKDRGYADENAECATLTYELGRLHEAQIWCQMTLSISPDNATVLSLLSKLQRELTPNTPWLLPQSDVGAAIDLSSYPVPGSFFSGEKSRHLATPLDHASGEIAFVDDSSRLGLEFNYFNGDDQTSEGKRMFEYTGGGVAALDYDLDGWCDLYFTQGTVWPPDPANRTYLDVLFRNLAGQKMSEVTQHIGIVDTGFGQGVTVGDFDNDGFPDLYVANIYGNRLYRNQGDGTYQDTTAESGLTRQDYWTTSCLLADLDGDGLPDIYDVTFLEGNDVFTRICRASDGKPRSCDPAGFSAALDHVYRNTGDGRFEEVTSGWGFDAVNGDGLGIVAGDYDDTGTMSVFIANDGRPNFFFAPDDPKSAEPHWNEIGVISGLAYDDTGAALACMGVAAGDANNDGLLDLFVTNFYNQSNNMYINLGSRTFTDRARSTGLHDPSWTMLGFGTQFFDANRDGWEDLILVNGHVDDFTHKQIPYKMRPQFFENKGERFEEHFGKEIGPFFDEPRLGRGLAKLDWNRDGLTDIAISHIEDPSTLLTNRTRKAGHGLSVRLVGTSGSRDAIGTRITVKRGETQQTRQLTGGDGYQASNERRVEFGLADNGEPVDIEIRWMGGGIERFSGVATDSEYLAIQGRNELLLIKKYATDDEHNL